jgi:hypothetical protein
MLIRMPSFISSAWIFRARQQFSAAIRTIRTLVSSGIGGRPGPRVEMERE